MNSEKSSGDRKDSAYADEIQQITDARDASTHIVLEHLGASVLMHDGELIQNGKEEYVLIQQVKDTKREPDQVTTAHQEHQVDNLHDSTIDTNSNIVIRMLKSGSGSQCDDSSGKVVIQYAGRTEELGNRLQHVGGKKGTDSRLVVIEYDDRREENEAATDGDKLICGLCAFTCFNVKDFLFHKSTHASHKRGLGCELCGLKYSRQKALADHYMHKHRFTIGAGKPDIKRVTNSSEKGVAVIESDRISFDSISLDNAATNISVQDMPARDEKSCRSDKSEPANTHSKTVVIHDGYGEKQVTNNNDVNNIRESSMLIQDHEKLVCDSEDEFTRGESTTNDVLLLDTNTDYTCNKHSKTGWSEMTNSFKYTDASNSSDTYSKTSSSVLVQRLDNDEVKSKLHLKVSDETRDVSDFGTSSRVTKRSLVEESTDPDFHFISNIGLVKGQSLNYGKHEFKCLHCQFKTQWRNNLCLHMKEKHSSLIGNDKHLLVNLPANKDGQKVLRMSEYVNMQKKKVKSKKVRGIETQDLPGDFPCSVCGKVYHRLRYLRCHMKRHTETANLLCSECGKAFKTKDYLAQHIRSHRVKEMYQCSQCEFSSSVSTLIHAHIQIHNDGCLVCDMCGAAFTDKSTLQRHKRVHDKSRPFACKYDGCTLRFKKEVTRNGHYKQHFTTGKFKCSLCGYVFRHKHHLLRHEKRIHNIKPAKDSNEPYVSNTHTQSNYQEDSLAVDVNTDNNAMEMGEVNLIINEAGTVDVSSENTDDRFDLESALQSGQLIIATDEDGNPVNYEMSDISMAGAYHTLLQGAEGQELDTHTILIPQADANNIVFEEVTETVGTYVES